MFIASPPCANGLVRDAVWQRAARLVGAASILTIALALPVLADPAPETSRVAPHAAAAVPCTGTAPGISDDVSLDTTSAKRFRVDSHDGNLELAHGLRYPQQVPLGSLTLDDGLLPHGFLIDSVRRL
jgi:hypothetical protein